MTLKNLVVEEILIFKDLGELYEEKENSNKRIVRLTKNDIRKILFK